MEKYALFVVKSLCYSNVIINYSFSPLTNLVIML